MRQSLRGCLQRGTANVNELSLFTGAGGGLLGTHLLGWRPVGYVEFNDYCQRIIAARIRDGYLPDAPIFGDIRAFLSEGFAASYTGMVDVITAGFPCQPFSTAGKRAGADDARNMWPATIECLRVVRPRFTLLENVPGLLSSGYFGTILGDLAESGYDARWRILSAAELGAPHKRDRLWVLANTINNANWNIREQTRESESEILADAASERRDGRDCLPETSFENGWICTEGDYQQAGDVADACTTGLAQREGAPGKWTHAAAAGGDWWTIEPDVGRVAHGVAARVDRLKALGNGQVPAVVRAAWLLLGGER